MTTPNLLIFHYNAIKTTAAAAVPPPPPFTCPLPLTWRRFCDRESYPSVGGYYDYSSAEDCSSLSSSWDQNEEMENVNQTGILLLLISIIPWN